MYKTNSTDSNLRADCELVLYTVSCQFALVVVLIELVHSFDEWAGR